MCLAISMDVSFVKLNMVLSASYLVAQSNQVFLILAEWYLKSIS